LALDTAFMEQGVDLLHADGFLGALVPRSFMYLSSFKEVRTEILSADARPEVIHEYALGILDGATVRTAGAVIRKTADASWAPEHPVVFGRLSHYPTDKKLDRFLETFPDFAAAGPRSEIDWFVARLGSLRDVPGMPYAYWATDRLRALFRQLPPLDSSQKGVLVPGRPNLKIADVKLGLKTNDESRFLRFHWEVPRETIGRARRWSPYVKGGRAVSFNARVDLVVRWEDEGREVKEWIQSQGRGHWSKEVRSPHLYFRAGITWSAASWRLSRFGVFPEGMIFSNKGPSIFPVGAHDTLSVAGLVNSSIGNIAMLMQTPERMWEVGLVSAIPFPIQPLPESATRAVAALVTLHGIRHAGDEACRDFTQPELRQAWEKSGKRSAELDRLLQDVSDSREQADRETEAKLAQLNDEVYRLYCISVDDRALIEREIARRPQSESGYSPEELDEGEEDEGSEAGEDSDVEDSDDSGQELSHNRTRDLVARWLSFYLKQILEADEDGIVPVWPTRTEVGLVARLKEVIQRDLGKEAMEALVANAPAFLGVADLPEWLAASREDTVEIGGKKTKLAVGFFPWHVAAYRNRPLFWMLSSEGFEKGKTRFRFQVYLHALKVTPDTLSRLASHYLEPAIEDFVRKAWEDAKAGAGRLEGKARAAADTEAQEWLNTLRALEAFQKAIGEVIQGPANAVHVPTNAKWLTRTIARVTGGQDIGHGYGPDVDFGVRVNLTPLARKGLLPKLALKKLGG